MPVALADLRIDAGLIAPMTRRAAALTAHSLLVRDGRILDILPTAAATQRYQAAALVERPCHLLMPGLIDANAQASLSLIRALGPDTSAALGGRLGSEFVYDSVLRAIGEMLKGGTTCFVDRYYFPRDTARAAQEQGVRAVIGLPVAAAASPWAVNAAEYLSRALELRDEYRGHPLLSTRFAPLAIDSLDDAACTRLATLADELDAGMCIDLHVEPGAHGAGLARLAHLGLLTPALNAALMTSMSGADIEQAARAGIALCLCPQMNLQSGHGLPPLDALSRAGMNMGLGSASAATSSFDLWREMRLCAAAWRAGAGVPTGGWDAIALATNAGAAAVGLETEVGTLEAGKWADVCCLDLSQPAALAGADLFDTLVYGGGRDLVSDVWVAGRQLVAEGALTRLDWPAVASKAKSWTALLMKGNRP